jgi:hypothetical protein
MYVCMYVCLYFGEFVINVSNFPNGLFIKFLRTIKARQNLPDLANSPENFVRCGWHIDICFAVFGICVFC